MLTDMQLKALKPAEKIYKVSDQHGLYVAVTPTGTASFRFDYRLNSRRETLVIGKYDSTLGMRNPRELNALEYGMSITLAEARLLLTRAHRLVEQGESPSRTKAEKRAEAAEVLTFGKWADKYFAETVLAASTKAMRKSIYDRNLSTEFGRLRLEEITPARLMARCEKIKQRGAAAPAVHAREIVLPSLSVCTSPRTQGRQPSGVDSAEGYSHVQAERQIAFSIRTSNFLRRTRADRHDANAAFGGEIYAADDGAKV